MKDALTSIGAILGVVAFFWRLFETVTSHVQLNLDVKVATSSTGRASTVAIVEIENKGLLLRRVHYAALLLGAHSESLSETAQRLAMPQGRTNPKWLGALRGSVAAFTKLAENPLIDIYNSAQYGARASEDRRAAIIPLGFIFNDQLTIGNEKVRTTVLLDGYSYLPPTVRVYLVTFNRYLFGLRWRTTSDLAFLR